MRQYPQATGRAATPGMWEMMEHWYYGFRTAAPLTDRAHHELRRRAPGGRLTAHELVCASDWGSDPDDLDQLLERHFDVHVHHCSWMLRRLCLRVDAADAAFLGELHRFEVDAGDESHISVWQFPTRPDGVRSTVVTIEVHADFDGGPDDVDDDAALDALERVQPDVHTGDLRLLAIGFAAVAAHSNLDPATPFPPLPPLDRPGEPLRTLARYLGLDGHWFPTLCELATTPGAATGEAGLTVGEFKRRHADARDAATHTEAARQAEALRRQACCWVEARGGVDPAWAWVDAKVGETTRRGYHEAIASMAHLELWHETRGESAAFRTRVQRLHRANRHKPLFAELLTRRFPTCVSPTRVVAR